MADWCLIRYLAPDKKEANDKSTHKWMVYVRGPKEEPPIDEFVEKVCFFLHDSYFPNNVVKITYVGCVVFVETYTLLLTPMISTPVLFYWVSIGLLH